jgi:hypothetical protein
MVSVPVRVAGVTFADALKVTDPLPAPVAPLVTVIHGAVLVALQPQPAGAVTVTPTEPPPPATVCEVGVMP